MLKGILLSGIALCAITGVALATPAKAFNQPMNVSPDKVAALTNHQLDQITAGGKGFESVNNNNHPGKGKGPPKNHPGKGKGPDGKGPPGAKNWPHQKKDS
jgi:hypothetical protein